MRSRSPEISESKQVALDKMILCPVNDPRKKIRPRGQRFTVRTIGHHPAMSPLNAIPQSKQARKQVRGIICANTPSINFSGALKNGSLFRITNPIPRSCSNRLGSRYET